MNWGIPLTDNLISLSVMYAITGMPFYVFMLTGFMRGINNSLLEAAELDDEAASPPLVPDEVLHPASRQASRAAHTSRERIRLRIIACSSFYRFPVKAGGVSGYSSSILFRRAVVNCRVQDEFQPVLCKLYKL